MNDLEQIAIQVLAAETGATDVKVYPEPYYCVLASDDYDIRVHIHYPYPQWVMARVGRGSSTKKKLDPESVRVAVRMAKKIDETLARAATLIREDGRFTLVDGSPHNSIWLRRSNARFKVQVAFHRSSLAVSGSAPQDEPLAREVESILQVR